jgi:hypothetical protein
MAWGMNHPATTALAKNGYFNTPTRPINPRRSRKDAIPIKHARKKME